LDQHVQIKVSTEGIAKEALRALSVSFSVLEAAGCVVPGASIVIGSIALGPAGVSSGVYLTLVNVVYNPFCVQLVKSITLEALGAEAGAEFFIGP
jgi:hypothetical protein